MLICPRRTKASHGSNIIKSRLASAYSSCSAQSLASRLPQKTGHATKIKTNGNTAGKGAATIIEAAAKTPLPEVNLTGVEKTATGLGHDLLLSNQEVNKRLVSSGMMTKEPWGYKLTEVGKLFGKETVKVTRAGHTFSNIEWDEAVVPYIFSTEELTNIDAKKSRIAQIMAQ